MTPAQTLPGIYRRLLAHCDAWQVEIADGTRRGRWPSAAELATRPEALAAVIDGESNRIRAEHGLHPRRHVAASRVLHHYLWTACLLFSGPWYLDRLVPRIPAEHVRIDPATGTLAVTPDGVPRRAGPRPDVPEDRRIEELHARLRDAVTEHLRPVLAAFAPEVRRGPRALWGMAGDDLVSGIWYLGRVFGDEERGVRQAAALLPEATPPFPAGAGFRRLRDRTGRCHPTRTRFGCCMYYAIRPAEACLTCPRTSDAERTRRLA